MIATLLMALGVVFLLIAAIGVIRLPDALQRMHSATKAGTLGTALTVAGAVVALRGEGGGSGALAVLFLLVTLPIGAQLLGRAAYRSGTTLKGIEQDALAEDASLHQSASAERTSDVDRTDRDI
jgi:multicomponent Na+:H+ antiporter subunit G